MIRFWDCEIYSVVYDKSNKMQGMQIWEYFYSGHKDETVYVMDSDGRYMGRITYSSLVHNKSFDDAIIKDPLVLEGDIWENGRKLFDGCENASVDEISMFPVVDKNQQLLCLAYHDEEANREIRQLRELAECDGALGFRDIFPEYDTVTIWGCNELAYYFARYLQRLGIGVNVRGEWWEYLGEWKNQETLGYRNLNIYAEGSWEKCKDIREYLLRSVSVEFECVNKIYEANMKAGIIKDAAFGFEELVELLKTKEVAILGTGEESIAAYDLFLENGVDIIGFIANEKKHLVGGKEIMTLADARNQYKNIVFVDCCEEHSAWGNGEVDNYDYKGYRRNEDFFCLKDYIHAAHSDLKNILKGKNLVLVGDIFLCKRFYEYYSRQSGIESVTYYNILEEEFAERNNDLIPLMHKENIREDDVFFVLVPEIVWSEKEKTGNAIGMNYIFPYKYIGKLLQEGHYNYFKFEMSGDVTEQIMNGGYSDRLRPKAIILGAAIGGSGNDLLRNVLTIPGRIVKMDYGLMNKSLPSFCVRLAGEKSEEVIRLFWDIVVNTIGEECVSVEFPDVDLFNQKMAELLQYVERPTSQELFVIFHMAYVAMSGEKLPDISQCVIYWERHSVKRQVYPIYTRWLADKGVTGLVITNCRNCIVRAGGLLRYFKKEGWIDKDLYALFTVLESPEEWNVDKSVWRGLEVAFEDLKCNPQRTLDKIGAIVGISFADLALDKKQVSYDEMEQIMKPVHNTREEFLSEFDRLRVSLVTCAWQRKRNYPYVVCTDFTRKVLQEMFIQEFRFEKEIKFCDEEEYLLYRRQRQRWINRKLMQVRMMEVNAKDIY